MHIYIYGGSELPPRGRHAQARGEDADEMPEPASDPPVWSLRGGERIFIKLMTLDRKLKASREGSK